MHGAHTACFCKLTTYFLLLAYFKERIEKKAKVSGIGKFDHYFGGHIHIPDIFSLQPILENFAS